jgi:hypothetical protein
MESVLACLASAKITVKRGGLNPRLGVPYEWSIDNGAGAEWLCEAPENLTFFPAMYWKLIEDDRSEYGPFRVTTLGYEYSLVIGETTELWALHWHPEGKSWNTGRTCTSETFCSQKPRQ